MRYSRNKAFIGAAVQAAGQIAQGIASAVKKKKEAKRQAREQAIASANETANNIESAFENQADIDKEYEERETLKCGGRIRSRRKRYGGSGRRRCDVGDEVKVDENGNPISDTDENTDNNNDTNNSNNYQSDSAWNTESDVEGTLKGAATAANATLDATVGNKNQGNKTKGSSFKSRGNLNQPDYRDANINNNYNSDNNRYYDRLKQYAIGGRTKYDGGGLKTLWNIARNIISNRKSVKPVAKKSISQLKHEQEVLEDAAKYGAGVSAGMNTGIGLDRYFSEKEQKKKEQEKKNSENATNNEQNNRQKYDDGGIKQQIKDLIDEEVKSNIDNEKFNRMSNVERKEYLHRKENELIKRRAKAETEKDAQRRLRQPFTKKTNLFNLDFSDMNKKVKNFTNNFENELMYIMAMNGSYDKEPAYSPTPTEKSGEPRPYQTPSRSRSNLASSNSQSTNLASSNSQSTNRASSNSQSTNLASSNSQSPKYNMNNIPKKLEFDLSSLAQNTRQLPEKLTTNTDKNSGKNLSYKDLRKNVRLQRRSNRKETSIGKSRRQGRQKIYDYVDNYLRNLNK